MSAETLAMPFRCELHAPSFSGDDDESLVEFFDQFDALADKCRLTDDEKCHYILRYIDRPSKQLWLTLPSYESCDYRKFKDEVVYQYPAALKAARRRTAQLARHHAAQIVHSPARDGPTSTASASRPSELALATLVARPIVPVPATVVGRSHSIPAPAARRDFAAPVVPHAPAAAALTPRHVQPVPTPAARHVRAVSVISQDHAASVVYPVLPIVRHAASCSRHDLVAPVPCHAAPAVRCVHTAPNVRQNHAALASPSPFTFRPALVPPVFSPTPLPFPLCPTPVLSASVTAQAQPSSIKTTRFEPAPTRHEYRECQPNDGHALPEKCKQDAGHPSCRNAGEEDVAIQKEEGRGQQAVVQLTNDEAELHAIDKQQKGENHQKTVLQRLDEDERGEIAEEDRTRMADEDQARRIVDEDRSRTADRGRQEIEQRQENVEQQQQKNTKYSLKNMIDTLPVPLLVSPPAPGLSPERLAEPDPRPRPLEILVPARTPFPRSQHARPLSLQHNCPRSPRSRSQIRLPRTQYRHSQIHFLRTKNKQERKLRTTHCPQLPAVPRRNDRRPIVQFFVPPPRKRKTDSIGCYKGMARGLVSSSLNSRTLVPCYSRLVRQACRSRIMKMSTLARPVRCNDRITAHTTEVTFTLSIYTGTLTTMELLAARTRPLAKREKDLVVTRTHAARSRSVFVTDLARRFASTVRTHDFQPRAVRRKTEVAAHCLVMATGRRNSSKSRSSRRHTSQRYRPCRRKENID